MPVDRSTPTKKSKSTQSDPTSPSKSGWSVGDKSLLFEHVVANGERDWDKAVPGKTAQQSREQWKKTLLPMIRKTCGLMG
ncbi:hypothetical protein I317_00307 [Kwoniella heveanensis CBS 569]|nr:hypothetical protein I317_00307 [Kwoniella heveanensis CBS 569]